MKNANKSFIITPLTITMAIFVLKIKLITICSLFFAAQVYADIFVRDDIITDPDYKRFSMCHDHGCKTVEQLSLSEKQWQQITQHFSPTAVSAAQEREQIAEAIAEFEKIIGIKTNTSQDKAGLFAHMGSAGQLDCIDESTNSTTYLFILQQAGLLKWHKPINHVTRGFFIFGWPHSSAAIREKQSKKEYAVDSWFEDNGQRPHIVSLSLWDSGWSPDDKKK